MEKSMGQVQRDEKGRLLPGSVLSLGRPKGARARLGEKFSKAMLADFKASGAEAIERFRQEDPGGYCKAIVSMMPRAVSVDVDTLKTVVVDFLGYDEDAFDGELIEDVELVEEEPRALQSGGHSVVGGYDFDEPV
jgi:hypothetical protein